MRPNPLDGVGTRKQLSLEILQMLLQINITSTNENTLIQADFSRKRLNLVKNFKEILKISQKFLYYFLRIFLNLIESMSKFSKIFKKFSKVIF